MAHAVFSPSGASRWLACPGSIAACRRYPESDSVHSREGTFAHEVAAECLTEGRDAASFLGRSDDAGEFTVDQDMADAVQVYVNAIRLLELTEDVDTSDTERRVSIVPGDSWGTADHAMFTGGYRHLHVWDYKHGAGVFVEVEDNPQLMAYAVGVLNAYPQAVDRVQDITLHVVQPRCHKPGHSLHRQHTVTMAELSEFADRYRDGIYAAKVPNAPLVSGPHCRFCPHAADCERVKADALTATQDVFEDVGELTPKETPPNPETLHPHQLSRILDAAPLVELWLKAVRQRAEELLRQGAPVQGYKLVQTTGHRRWTVTDEEVTAQLKELGVDPLQPPKLVSPSQAEKQVKGKTLKGKVAALAAKPITGLALVPSDDKRPAYNPAAVFAELTEDSDNG